MVIDTSSILFLLAYFAYFYVRAIRCRLPLPCLLCSYLSDKCCNYRQRTVGDRHRKCRETPGRWSKHDLRALPGIKFGIVAKALKHILVDTVPLNPGCNGTPCVRTDCGISKDAVGSEPPRR